MNESKDKTMTLQDNKYKFAKKLESEDEYRKMADDLLTFALKESSLDINTYPLGLMINPKDFATFVEHSPYFADAYNTALRIIGARIKRLMYQGTIDRQFALEMLPLYDPEFRQYLHEKKQKGDAAPGQTRFITIEMPEYRSIPNSVWVELTKYLKLEEREEILRIASELFSFRPTKEEVAEMAKIADKCKARRALERFGQAKQREYQEGSQK